MTVRVAVIGAGVMGADHARILAEDIPGARLQVVCDADAARAHAVGEACGAEDIATDPLEAATRSDVDAVLIASPDETHAVLTVAALEAGKRVLCEKPLAPTTQACLTVIAAEAKTGRKAIQIGFMRRFDEFYSEMKSILDSGTLGRALMMHNFHRNVSAPNGFTAAMAITNSAPHEFDIARFVLGQEFRSVTAFEGARDDGAIAPVVMVLETDADQIVTVEVNNTAGYGYDVRGEIVGARGSVDLAAPGVSRQNRALQAVQGFAADWRPRFAEAYRRQNKAWIRSVEADRPDPTAADAWDGYCASVVAEAGVAALRSRTRTPVTLAERPPLYTRATEDHDPEGRPR